MKECVLLLCAGKMKTGGRDLHCFTGDWCFLGGVKLVSSVAVAVVSMLIH